MRSRAEGPAPVGSHGVPSKRNQGRIKNKITVMLQDGSEENKKKKKNPAKLRKYQNNSGLCCSSKTTTGQSPFLACFNVSLSQCLEQLQCLTAITQEAVMDVSLKPELSPLGNNTASTYAHSDFKFLKCNLSHFELYFSHAHYHYSQYISLLCGLEL